MSILGMNLLTWRVTLDESMFAYFRKSKDMGFDGVEVPLRNPLDIPPAFIQKMRQELDELGLERACIGGLGPDSSLVDDDESIYQRAKVYLKKHIDICHDLNCRSLNGVLYGGFKVQKDRCRTQEEWDRVVHGLREVADYAKPKNVMLGLEVINRYETYFMNTIDEGLQLLRHIDRDNVKLHIDAYHMNIEEKNFYDPVIRAKGKVGHVHCCANDRGIPGTGHINWDEFFKALVDIDYHGWVSLEAFFGPVEGKPVMMCLYRNTAAHVDDLPREGVKFLREKTNQYGV
jgi:D-psicose/D-tagatose/L-ribulose 3-epimerase